MSPRQPRHRLSSSEIVSGARHGVGAQSTAARSLRLDSYHVEVAAEAYAAALFAQAGCDVLVQYGANQPEYDLMVAMGGARAKVSVKGSQDGGWVLVASYKRGRTYHEAIDAWVASHADPGVLYCLVQFKSVEFGSTPRLYLAAIGEVADYLKRSCAGHGYTSVREHYVWSRGKAGGSVDSIPAGWAMTEARIGTLIHRKVAS